MYNVVSIPTKPQKPLPTLNLFYSFQKTDFKADGFVLQIHTVVHSRVAEAHCSGDLPIDSVAK